METTPEYCKLFQSNSGSSTWQNSCSLATYISQTIQVKWPKHNGWSKDELIHDVLLWTITHGHTSFGQPAKTYIHQLCADTGCCLEDSCILKSRLYQYMNISKLVAVAEC